MSDSRGTFVLDWPVNNGTGVSVEVREADRPHKVSGRILVLEDRPDEEVYSLEGAGVQADVLVRHFWFAVRRRAIADTLMQAKKSGLQGNRMVEFGCSNGFVMAHLEKMGWQMLGVDMHMTGLRNAEQMVRGPLVCGKLEHIVFADPLDAVGLFDVIEHLPNDKAVLEEVVRNLRPGGYLAVTAPALMSLWSEFDVLLGHKRRYTTGEIKQLMGELGLEVVSVRYLFSFAMPLLWLQRRLKKRTMTSREKWRRYFRPPPAVLNRLLTWAGDLEIAFARYGVHPPFGTSVIALARRRDKDPTV